MNKNDKQQNYYNFKMKINLKTKKKELFKIVI